MSSSPDWTIEREFKANLDHISQNKKQRKKRVVHKRWGEVRGEAQISPFSIFFLVWGSFTKYAYGQLESVTWVNRDPHQGPSVVKLFPLIYLGEVKTSLNFWVFLL